MTKEELEKEAEEYARQTCFTELPNPSLSEDIDISDEILEAYLAGAEPREKRIEELEKENAELKGIKDVATLIRANNDTVVTLMQLNNMLVSKRQQLTKAKEILKQWLQTSKNNSCDNINIVADTEQFISEVEK